MYTDLTNLCVTQAASIRQAIALMDQTRLGLVLVVEEEHRLVGTVTDGDVRRAMLANLDLSQPVSVLLARKADTLFARPVTAPATASSQELLDILRQHSIRHLPVVDDAQRVVGLVTLDEFVSEAPLPVHAVVMAGGKGSRLHPLTDETPKPMLPIGDRPLLEIIIGQLRDAGITQVKVTTHHRPEKIAEHFGDGTGFGVQLTYVEEGRPLGTGGGLGLIETPTETTLVMNGDILTRVDFRAMLAYHREHRADLTVGVRQYDIKVPYGVMECEGVAVRRLNEKPVLGVFVNAGIYLLEPDVFHYIPNGRPFDMTDLIQCLLHDGKSVVSFPIREYWIDIGQEADYEEAQVQARQWAQ